jgi:hypothetical protein
MNLIMGLVRLEGFEPSTTGFEVCNYQYFVPSCINPYIPVLASISS